MKVLKFGGTSMGSASAIRKVQEVVKSQSEPVVVVVSAVGGVTDKLVLAANTAVKGEDYQNILEEVVQIHSSVAQDLFDDKCQAQLYSTCENVWQELRQVLQGVFLTRELSTKSYDTIVGIGERLSSVFLSQLMDGAKLFDSRLFITTEANGKGHHVKYNETMQAIGELKFSLGKVNVFPGFIAANAVGENTTLGRGGSDYSAALLAAGLEANVLEIWTDVDGFMSADPRVIKRAYCIEHLSYAEAMELSHFGAKVIYPPTIIPALQKQIPIKVKNTFNASARGTLIDDQKDEQQRVKGLSSIKDVALLTLQGNGMIGITGISMRMFSALASHNINIILISQASSESSISVVLASEDVEVARLALIKEFDKEIARREINGVSIDKEMAVVAIVGEGMKHAPGVSGKLFSDIGRNGINIYAIAQGASELNISFVIHARDLRKCLNVVHESFFLSAYQAIHLYLVGVGTVGKNLLQKITRQSERLLKTEHLSIRLAGLANSKQMIFNDRGLELESALEVLKEASPGTIDQFVEQIIANNHSNSVFVDCTASALVAEKYQRLLENNVSVVTANKIAGSSSYARYEQLKKTARQKGVKYLFETNVGAGLPIINTINGMVQSGDRILQLEAVLSGTLNYIVNNVSADRPLSEVVLEAKELGYSEPDPRIDLKGTDVLRKLLILARESEYALEEQHVEIKPFVPAEYFTDESVDGFLQRLKAYDDAFEAMRAGAAAKGKVIRYAASLKEGRARVGFIEVDAHHPFYNLADSNNKVILRSDYYYEHPMEIKGYGAGADVTAAGVFADIIKVVNL
ncbi:bifunctional aspartate kinase/homoserine dehydrogenase I [Carboxylicivirga mesophila]|uniref:Bifunctional aspartate kinase/homoserine dehydrogenase I n=1 Tax=Carboxylicivirga mesophila TaxID=1166478 RepID=A0ABS5KCU5_9BACT|nr:bifunctional aspartate kinase/homoserine dehydrogenase I [Carboxylicivirga mesophila]MBS2212163.1 bifunctional aspartate kinase/homoserine dehydrogenase I [Carboxylicivirga mesophila]